MYNWKNYSKDVIKLEMVLERALDVVELLDVLPNFTKSRGMEDYTRDKCLWEIEFGNLEGFTG